MPAVGYGKFYITRMPYRSGSLLSNMGSSTIRNDIHLFKYQYGLKAVFASKLKTKMLKYIIARIRSSVAVITFSWNILKVVLKVRQGGKTSRMISLRKLRIEPAQGLQSACCPLNLASSESLKERRGQYVKAGFSHRGYHSGATSSTYLAALHGVRAVCS